MQAQASYGLWEFLLFWIFTGSGLLGLPPGERDAALLKSVPPQTLAYFEWSARGQGQAGATGIDGFAADPEVRQFFELLDTALAQRTAAEDEAPLHQLRHELPQLVKLLSAHPGCVFLGFEPKPADKPGAAWINMLTGLHGGVILSSGNDTDALWQLLNRILSSLPDYTFDAASPTQSIPISIPGYKLVVHREAGRILFALGEGTLPRVIDGLSGRLPGLEANPRFRQSLDRVAIPRVSTVGWIDGQGIIAGATAALGPLGGLVRPILAMVGADALDHIVQTSGVDNGTMIQRTFIATGGRTDGILVLAAGQPIQAKQLSHIPADADFVLATSLSLKSVYQEARKLLTTAQPLSVRVFDEAVKQLESELELKIVDDVLPAFGDTITAFDSPSAGGVIATSLVVSLEVRNVGKAEIVFQRLMKLVEQSLPMDAVDESNGDITTLRQQPFLGHTIYYVHTSGRSDRPPVTTTPTFCLTTSHLLFAIHPQAMKAQLRQMKSTGPKFDQIADQKIVLPAGDILTYAYLNGPRANGIAGTVWPFLSHSWMTGLEAEGLSLDAFAVPSAAAIAPYFGDSSAVISRQKDGLLVETRNAPPIIVSVALLSAYDKWLASEYEFLEEARRRKANGVEQAQLGAPAGNEVVPAVAQVKDAPAADTKDKPSPYRKLAPIFLKALIPDDIKPMIPDEAFRQLEEGPSQATIQRREEARKRREERRRKRLEPVR